MDKKLDIPKNVVIYDWLSITSKTLDFNSMAELIGMRSVAWAPGHSSYYEGRAYYNGVSIHYNNSCPGVWLEMSGQGCRVFETVGNGDYQFLFELVSLRSDDMQITRLDIAFDDHTGILDIERIYKDTIDQSYVARARSWLVEVGSSGRSVYIGSKKSETLIRIYDKAAERNKPDEHWIRVEFQLRNDRCMQFVKFASELGLQKAFSCVLLNYLRYVDCSTTNDTNKCRWPMASYWSSLIDGALPQSIFVKPGIEYNLARCEQFVYKQAGNAIAALLECYNGDIDKFLLKLHERGTMPNPKYQEMIKDARYQELYDATPKGVNVRVTR